MMDAEVFWWNVMGRYGVFICNPLLPKQPPRPPSPAKALREKARQLILEAEAIERAEGDPS